MWKKALNAIVAAAVVVTGAAACQSSGGGGSASTVVIGYENNGSVDPAQAALSLGYYKKYIKAPIKMVYFDSGPAALTALGSGSLDIMTGIGNPPVASALANGVPVSVIWAEDLSQTDQALVVRKSAGISSVGDLKGKTIATVVGSTASYALSGVLAAGGLSNGDVTLRNLDPQTLGNAWKTGQIDAAYIWYPVLGQILGDNGVELASDATVQSKLPIFNLSVTSKKWAAANPSLVRGFIQAQNAGVNALRSGRSTALARMIKDTGETMTAAKVAAASTRWFSVSQQVGPDALGPDDAHSLVATSLVAASTYLHSLDSTVKVLGSAAGAIDRSFVTATAKDASGS
jgi:taurine ABC transporter substrate-binding protein